MRVHGALLIIKSFYSEEGCNELRCEGLCSLRSVLCGEDEGLKVLRGGGEGERLHEIRCTTVMEDEYTMGEKI